MAEQEGKGRRKKKNKDQKDEKEELFGERPQQPSTELLYSFGFESGKLGNLHFLDESTLLTSAGNTLQFIDTKTGKIDILMGRDGGGIGAIGVHPNRKVFAAAEKGDNPNIYMYTYPEKTLSKTLVGGTQREFSCLAFNSSGDKLATVGAEPDFTLTVWNWAEERIILRSKAFGARILRVSFNKGDDGQLTTCGMGHIKFWKMAQTFTGLKLQGAIGKFGKVEISDIAGYIELPDAKVLSGSEWGSLLLWQNNLIKTEINRTGLIPCHEGAIDVVMLEDNGECFITAGHDGYLRWWEFDKIDTADTYDHAPIYTLDAIYELKVADKCIIKGLTRNADTWMIQDGSGAFWSIPYVSWESIKDGTAPPSGSTLGKLFTTFHAGKIRCLQTSPMDHVAVSAGDDGTVRLFDYIHQKQICSERFSSGATCLHWLSTRLDPEGRTVAIGFSNGVVRILRCLSDRLDLTAVMKPHTKPIRALCYSFDGAVFVTASDDQTLFFFECSNPVTTYSPIGFCQMPSMPRYLYWERELNQVIACLQDGSLVLVETPQPHHMDHDASFEFKPVLRRFLYNQRMKPSPEEQKAAEEAAKAAAQNAAATPAPGADGKEGDAAKDGEEKEGEEGVPGDASLLEEEEDDGSNDVGPWAVNFVLQADAEGGASKNLIIGLQHAESVFEFNGHSWEDPSFEVFTEDPIKNISYYDTVVVACRYSRGGTFLLMPCEKGRVLIRSAADRSRVMLAAVVHDGLSGAVLQAATSYDDKYLLTVGSDGCFFCHKIIDTSVEPKSKAVPLKRLPPSRVDVVDDISKADAYSIQEAKLKADEDHRRKLVEQKMKSLREQVQDLLAEYEQLLDTNAHAPQGCQLSKEDMSLDPETKNILERANEERVDICRKELAWATAKKELRLKKLNDAFWGALQVERIHLKSFSSGRAVSSFRTPHLTPTQRENIESVHKLIQAEEAKRRPQAPGSASQSQVIRPGMPKSLSDPSLDQTHLGMDDSGNMIPEQDKLEISMGHPSSVGTMDQTGTTSGGDGGGGSGSSSEGTPTKSKSGSKRAKSMPHAKSALDKAEARKSEREERRRGMQELINRKPSDTVEDQRDVAVIVRAEKFMGDYKLKTDPDYVVPEMQRVTAERKFRQLILLEESINTLRMDFNDRFLALRDLKMRLIGTLNRDAARIAEINALLAPKPTPSAASTPAIPPVTPTSAMTPTSAHHPSATPAAAPPAAPVAPYGMIFEEQPEQRFNVDKETLKKFEREQIRAAKKAAAMEKAAKGFGADLMAAGGGGEEEDSGSEGEGDHHHHKEEGKEAGKEGEKGADPTSGPATTDKKKSVKGGGGEDAKGGAGGAKGEKDGKHGSTAVDKDGKLGDKDKKVRPSARRESVHLTAKQRFENERKERVEKIPQSAIETEEEFLNTQALMFERDQLTKKTEKTISTFDDALDELRREKFKLEGDLKMADMKMLLLYRELVLLKDFKKRDQELTKRLEDRTAEKADILSKIQQCQDKLSERKIEIEKLLARERTIMNEFNTAIATSQPCQEALVKIFKRRVKRKKRGDDEESDDEDSDLSDISDDDDDDDDGEPDECPPNCDPAVFKRVLELREKRLDQEEIVNDFQKSIEVLRKENEQLSKKEKTIDTQLKQVEKDLQLFQNEKQKRLNELEAVVVLKMKQIQCLTGGAPPKPDASGTVPAPPTEGDQAAGGDTQPANQEAEAGGPVQPLRMPTDLRNCVVFTNQGLKGLHSRILDLAQEKKTLNRYMYDLRKQQHGLARARKEKTQNVQDWESKVQEIQLLKFGQRINLESLENVSVDRKTEELKVQLKKEELKWEAELKKWDQKLQDTKVKQADITGQNSLLLRKLGSLRQDQQKLEDILNVSQTKILSHMSGGSKVSSAQDRRHLKELVILQQQEIDQLKAEIAMLSRKGGHVYTPVVNKVTN